MLNLAANRTDYAKGELRRATLLDDPLAQFHAWLDEAVKAGVPEPTAMSLATVGNDGIPRVRTVLLKGLDARGFAFYTNLESRKGRQLAERATASLLFAWVTLERQIIITGSVERVADDEAFAYFASRPLRSRLAAWSSAQSQPVASREALEAQFRATGARFADGAVPLPPFWGGYRVQPARIEFWQGRRDRLHDRFEYTPQADGAWAIERLAP
jgi:pyridoxamine 5'-phosphate oxidase